MIWRNQIRFYILCVILACISAISVAQNDYTYEVIFSGIEDEAILADLKAISKTIELKDRVPTASSLLLRRVRGDEDRFSKALQSFSYYDASVNTKIEWSKSPITITFQIKPGPPYLLQEVNFQFDESGSKDSVNIPTLQTLGLTLQQRATATEILTAETIFIARVKDQGFPFVKSNEREVLVDHADRSLHITYHIHRGPLAYFGETKIVGLETLEESYVRNRIEWNKGEKYDPEKTDKTQNRLIETRLFTIVRIELAESLDENGHLPITINLKESKHRTLKAGLGYNTDEGPIARFGWEHRNLLDHAELLSINSKISAYEYSGSVEYNRPDFLDPSQTLILDLRIAEDNPDVYESQSISTSAILQKILNEELEVHGGLALRLSRVTQLNQVNKYRLISLPLGLDYDTSDDLLNPTDGYRLSLGIEPFYNIYNDAFFFVKNSLIYSHYLPLLDDPEIIFAGRLGIGSQMGASRDRIPADLRFYTGGGGSIRGYDYQTVAPMVDNFPIGGRSLFETSMELRWRFAENMGIVAFLDGGMAFESSLPDFSETIQWGTGLGYRYYTPIGPVRLDIGFPINRRPRDDSFQLYISIGQAF